MPRKPCPDLGQPAVTPALDVHEIKPGNVYLPVEVQRLLRLRKSSLRRAIKQGLKVSRRCGRYYFLGAWLLEWLAGGVKQSSPTSPTLTSKNGKG
jgi:hypothetical protein